MTEDEAVACPYPVVRGCGMCCGHDPCDLEWEYPCEAEGGCWDRSTCPGCAVPKTPSRSRLPGGAGCSQ